MKTTISNREALHYLQILQSTYGMFQPEMRDAIDLAFIALFEKTVSQETRSDSKLPSLFSDSSPDKKLNPKFTCKNCGKQREDHVGIFEYCNVHPEDRLMLKFEPLPEEPIDGQIYPDAPKYRCAGCDKIHQDFDYDPKTDILLVKEEAKTSYDKKGICSRCGIAITTGSILCRKCWKEEGGPRQRDYKNKQNEDEETNDA
jgi:hypothetical protein